MKVDLKVLTGLTVAAGLAVGALSTTAAMAADKILFKTPVAFGTHLPGLGTPIVRVAKQLDRVYSEASYVGSLVTEGETGRPTEYYGNKQQPPDWWKNFYARHKENTGQDWTGLEELWRELDLIAR